MPQARSGGVADGGVEARQASRPQPFQNQSVLTQRPAVRMTAQQGRSRMVASWARGQIKITSGG
jgi:hypothetical protein